MIPHGTFPNQSDKFRLIQYIKMAPHSDKSIVPAQACKQLYKPQDTQFPDEFQLTALGKMLYAVQEGNTEQQDASSTTCTTM